MNYELGIMNTKQMVINGQLINYYHQRGLSDNGPTLVFLHGWALDATIWFNVVEALSSKAKDFYLLDLPGFGKSENPNTPFDIKDYTDVVSGFMKQVAPEQTIVIGHSFGGRIAAHLASVHGNDLKKIVLVNAAGIRTSADRSKFLEIITKSVKPLLSEKIKTKLYNFIGSDYSSRTDLKETFKKIMTSDIDIYKNINIPTLIIWGDNDDVTPVKSGEKIHSLIKNSELFIIKDAGHMSFVDHPEIFIEQVIKFISDVERMK